MARHHRRPNSDRAVFRRYLEDNGVMDRITNVLSVLYELEEKPSNPLEFIQQHLNAAGHVSTESVALQQEVTDLRKNCATLTQENKELKEKLRRHRPKSDHAVNAKN